MTQKMSINTQNSFATLFVSCWHMNESESAAMWHQYGASSSLCIQTTYELLAECLPENVSIGMVRYINHNEQIIPQDNGFNYIMHERKSFEHEREVRAIHWTLHNPADGYTQHAEPAGEFGFKLKVDMQRLVQKILISPAAPAWFKPLVEDLLIKYHLNKPLIGSELGDEPLY